jgi:hypothetical protein
MVSARARKFYLTDRIANNGALPLEASLKPIPIRVYRESAKLEPAWMK